MTTPTSASTRLGQRLDDLHAVIMRLRDAETTALSLRMDADIAESKAFLAAQGSVDARKHLARIETAEQEFVACRAEADVRHLLRLMREAQARVDVGRTYSADQRAELSVLGRDGRP